MHHHLGADGDIAERAEYYGTKMVFIEPRFDQPVLVSRENGELKPWTVETHAERLPAELRPHISGGHGGSEVFITNEFVNASLEERRPLVDIYKGVAYAAPGICAQDFSPQKW